MRKPLDGAAEDLCEPSDSFLMRHIHEVVAAKDIRQAVLAGVRLVARHLRRPNVPPPSPNREQKEKREDACCNNRCQDLSPRARKSRCPSSQTRLRLDFKRESCPLAIIQDAPRLIEISLERSDSADVQSNAMGPTAQHFGVPQFQGDYIKPLFF